MVVSTDRQCIQPVYNLNLAVGVYKLMIVSIGQRCSNFQLSIQEHNSGTKLELGLCLVVKKHTVKISEHLGNGKEFRTQKKKSAISQFGA